MHNYLKHGQLTVKLVGNAIWHFQIVKHHLKYFNAFLTRLVRVLAFHRVSVVEMGPTPMFPAI